MIIVLFPSTNQTSLSAVDASIFYELRRFLFFVTSTGIVLQEEKNHTRPQSWQSWVHVSSKRRCLVSLFLLHRSYSTWAGIPRYPCSAMTIIPAPAAKFLWDASTPEQWEPLYNKWLAKWDGQCFLQSEFQKVGNGIVMNRRAEMWLEEADEFGLLIMAMSKFAFLYISRPCSVLYVHLVRAGDFDELDYRG